MKRLMIIGFVVALVASVSAMAFADEDSTDGDTELNDKQAQRALSLAEYFGPRLVEEGDPVDDEEAAGSLNDEIVDLRTGDTAVGWGAMYKLLLLAEYNGQDLGELVEELKAEGEGWKFGQRLKEMRNDSDWKSSSDTPKNFGQFKKQQRQAAED
jgi:hypothetical protein